MAKTKEYRTITVTQEDIDNGQQGSGFRCALGLAAGRAFADAGGRASIAGDPVNVYVYNGELHPDKGFWYFRAEARATTTVRRFDEGKGIKPGDFVLMRYRYADEETGEQQ